MTARNVWVLILLTAFALASGTAFAATDELATQLSWPKTFTINGGESSSFGFPVTQPGSISVDVSWNGAALKVSLLGPDRKPVLPLTTNNSPVKLSYTVTEADIQKGAIWLVTLTPPATPAGKPVAEGRISVSYPAFDAQKVKAEVTRIRGDKLALATKTSRTRVSTSVDYGAEAEKTRVKQNAELETSLTNKMTLALEKVSAERIVSVKNIRAAARGTMAPGAQAQGYKPPANPKRIPVNTDPTIFEIAPDQGFTNDKVVLKTVNFKPDATAYDVSFYVESSAVSPAICSSLPTKILSVAQSGTEVDFTVALPPLPGGFPQISKSYVLMNAKSPFALSYGPDFIWTTVPVASITGITPSAARPNDWLDLTGYNFTAKTKFRFALPDGKDVPAASIKFTDANHMKAQLPYYSAKQDASASIYAQTTAPNGATLYDKKVLFIAEATVPKITGTDRFSVIPGETLLVQGTGFDPGAQVIFKTSGGTQYSAYPNPSTDTNLLVKVPSIPLVPLGGVPVTISVKNYGVDASDPYMLHLNPIIDVVQVTDASKVELVQFGCDQNCGDWACCTIIYDVAVAGQSYIDKHGLIFGKHVSNALWGHKSDDKFALKNMNLKNGWKFSHVSLDVFDWANQESWHSGAPYGVNVSDISQDAQGRTVVTIHSWVDASINSACYNMGFWIEGPKGFPCQ